MTQKTSRSQKFPGRGRPRAPHARQRILDSAMLHADQYGLKNFTIDDIVNDTGISRATVYRYYKNRDLLLNDLVQRFFTPFETEIDRIFAEQTSFHDKLEKMFIWSVSGLEQGRWLGEMMKDGLNEENFNLFKAMYGNRAHAVLGPHLDRARETGAMRQTLATEDAIYWFIKEITLAFLLGPTDVATLKKNFRLFLAPVMCAQPTSSATDHDNNQRTTIEAALSEIQHSIQQVRNALSDKPTHKATIAPFSPCAKSEENK